ncbi:hypothetical protein BDF22DRAFT_682684 [Syncephalis plumigaleata]|nr:hypothetical protein BDF22DRAFT_682684 [Syncephalis plumigaleata]
MKFNAPPPYGDACDFMVNMADCKESETYLIIYGVGAVIHLLCVFIGVNVIIRFRQKQNINMNQSHASTYLEAGQYTSKSRNQRTAPAKRLLRSRRIIPRPIRVTTALALLFIITRLVHASICAFDISVSFSNRTVMLILSILPGLWALLIFAAGVVETVELTIDSMPARLACCVNDLRWSLPSRHFIILFLTVLGLGMTVASPLLAWYAGVHGSVGEWQSYFTFIRLSWCIWSSVFIVLGIMYSYYAGALTMMIRQLQAVEKAEHGQMSKQMEERQKSRLGTSKSMDGATMTTPRLSSATETGTITTYNNDTAVNSRSPSMQAGSESPVLDNRKSAPPKAKFSALYRYAFQDQASANAFCDVDLDGATIPENDEDDTAYDDHDNNDNDDDDDDVINEGKPIYTLMQQRRTMYYLIFSYFTCALIALVWGNDARWIIMNRIASKVFAAAFVAALWPLAVGAVLWKSWQTERLRERKEALRIQRLQQPRDVTREWYRTLAAITNPWSNRVNSNATTIAPSSQH